MPTNLVTSRNPSASGTSTRTSGSWRDNAACRDIDLSPDHDPFYAPFGQSDETQDWLEARAICATCPVEQACLDASFTEERPGAVTGFRGGKTPAERLSMRRARQRTDRLDARQKTVT